MQGHEPMPLEFNLEAEMEIVRNDIATTMTGIYKLKLKEKFFTRKILNPSEKNRNQEVALAQVQSSIKAESDYLAMLREIEKELNKKIVAELEKIAKNNKEVTGDAKSSGAYPDPDWHEEKQA